MSPSTVSRPDFATALIWASRSLPSRPLNPVLAGIRLKAESGVLLVSSFDLDQSSSSSLAYEGNDLDVIVSGRLLVDIVRNLPGDRIAISEKGPILVIESGRSSFSLMKLPPDTYPTLPTVPPLFGRVSGQEFAEATARVCFAASTDTTTPVLTTVMVEASAEKRELKFAATDKFCLATTSIPYEPEEGLEESGVRTFLVPAKVLDAYGKNLAKESTVGLHAEAEGQSIFGVSGAKENSTTRVFGGEYPKYEQLVNGTFTIEAEIHPSDLVEAVKRVSLLAEPGQGVRLSFSEGALEVSTLSRGGPSASASASETLELDYAGEEIELVFNPSYLTTGLGHFDTRTVRMQMTAPGRPVKFTTGQEDDPFIFLAMPLRV